MKFSKPLRDAIVTDLTAKNQLEEAYRFMIEDAADHPLLSTIGSNNLLTFMWQYELSNHAQKRVLTNAISEIALESVKDARTPHPESIALTEHHSVDYALYRNRHRAHIEDLMDYTIWEIDRLLRGANTPAATIYKKRYPQPEQFVKALLIAALPYLVDNFMDDYANADTKQPIVFDYINNALGAHDANTYAKVTMTPYSNDGLDFVLTIESSKPLAFYIEHQLIPYLEARTYQTFFILKPDAVEKGLVFDILKEAESHGLTLKSLERLRATTGQLKYHYRHQLSKPYYHEIERYMTRGDSYIGIFEGYDAVNTWRQLLGDTNPSNALPNTLRHRYGDHQTFENIAHGSDSKNAAIEEINHWFGT